MRAMKCSTVAKVSDPKDVATDHRRMRSLLHRVMAAPRAANIAGSILLGRLNRPLLSVLAVKHPSFRGIVRPTGAQRIDFTMLYMNSEGNAMPTSVPANARRAWLQHQPSENKDKRPTEHAFYL